MEFTVLVCAGGCGMTTENINPYDFWRGELKDSSDPGCLIPVWTCPACKEKNKKEGGNNASIKDQANSN
jgi:hypothetical protein